MRRIRRRGRHRERVIVLPDRRPGAVESSCRLAHLMDAVDSSPNEPSQADTLQREGQSFGRPVAALGHRTSRDGNQDDRFLK